MIIFNINVIAIIVSLISLTLSIVGFVYPPTDVQKQEKWYKLKKLWSLRYTIFHAIILFCLTCYVLINWEKCIPMQFFTRFDGNNILFLVWIILIFLIIYKIEGKGIMVAKYKHEETQKNICDATLKYKLDAMLEQFKSSNPNPEGNHQKEEGEK